METIKLKRTIGVWIGSIVAVVFGLMTIKSGGTVLLIDGTFRQEVGNYVSFVVWFNFCAGFFYVFAGISLWMQKSWCAWVSILIAVSTFITLAILGIYIFNDGVYEIKTVIVMSMRTAIWTIIAIFAYRKLAN